MRQLETDRSSEAMQIRDGARRAALGLYKAMAASERRSARSIYWPRSNGQARGRQTLNDLPGDSVPPAGAQYSPSNGNGSLAALAVAPDVEEPVAVGTHHEDVEEPVAVGTHHEDVEEPVAVGTHHEDVDSGSSLREQVSAGVKWGVIASIVTQVSRFAFVAALMRMLGPENFGIVGQASVFITITYIFMHLGTAATIIQRPQLDRAEVGTAWWINVALGFTFAGLTVVGAPLIASFFHTGELTAVLRVLSICFLLKAFAVVPTALLYRNMRLRALGLAEIASSVLGGIIAIVAALAGAGYWALVIQSIAMDGIILIALVMISGLPDPTWSSKAAKEMWGFSSRVMGSDLARYMSESSDKFLVGRYLGATELGFYSLAYRVLQMPLLMMQQAGRVILPTFSRLQDDRERLAHIFLKSTESTALIACPVMVVTILCAPVAVPIVFGDAWAPAVLPLQLLAATTIQSLIFSITGGVLLAVGRADWEFRWELLSMVVSFISFVIGLNWGISGVAAAFLISGLVMWPVRLAMLGRVTPITGWGYARCLTPAVVSSAALCGVWLLVAGALQDITSGLALISCSSLAGLAAYLVAARVLWPEEFRYQFEFARQVVNRSRS
jgi:PST family polysaccharide transporter